MTMASSLAFNSAAIPVQLPRNSSLLLVRSSASEGPIRRPSVPVKEAATPSVSRPSPPSPSSPPSSPSPPTPPSSASSVSARPATSSLSSSVTVEYQRQRAKELQEYFLDRKYEQQAAGGRVFGWTSKNEISNGRWAMFGIAVGLLTEYATGSDFVDQLKIIVSNLGIADLE